MLRRTPDAATTSAWRDGVATTRWGSMGIITFGGLMVMVAPAGEDSGTTAVKTVTNKANMILRTTISFSAHGDRHTVFRRGCMRRHQPGRAKMPHQRAQLGSVTCSTALWVTTRQAVLPEKSLVGGPFEEPVNRHNLL